METEQQMLQYIPGKTFDDREWKAPGADMGINWTGKSASEICKIVTTNLPSAEKLMHHFHDDARIAWAVHSGRLPLMAKKQNPLPVAPPGNYPEWVKITRIWAFGGFPCPK